MGDGPRYNLKSPSVKRLMQEAKELREATEQYHAQPLDDNLYEWHFTIRGAPDTDFADGVYHGRIMLPPDYPMKPPSIVLLTPTGRFEINKKICLSISGHHPESWQPSWSIRTALMAIIGFLPSPGKGAIGALDYPPEERKKLAKKSKDWKCPVCGVENHQLLRTPEAASEETDGILQEVKDLARKISFKGESTSSSEDSVKSQSSFQEDNEDGNAASSADSSAAVESAAEPTDTNGKCQDDTKPPIAVAAGAAAGDASKAADSDAARESSKTPPPEPLTPAFPVDDAPLPNASSTASASTNASTASAEEDNVLRQRARRLEDVAEREVAAREAAEVSREATPAPVRPAPTPRNHAHSTTSSYYLMILLSITIGVLLLRRILKEFDFQFDFQFDYNVERQ